MNREPKISEIEKLIKHFVDNGREDELLEVLARHNIKSPAPDTAIDPKTHEINPEGYVIEKIEEREGLISKTKRFFAGVVWTYKEKWYVRYATYYVILFLVILLILNLPLIINSFKYDKSESKNPGPQVVTYEELVENKMADSAPLNPGEVIPSTNTIVIPKISVNAPVIFLNTRDEKTIEANLTNGVVHYQGTANPGEVGNSFITGHSSNFWWIHGQYNYVFVNLDKLVVGDQVVIYYNGKKFVYQVRGSKVVPPTDTSVLAPTDTPTLTLMTCTPPGTNWKRLIVTLDQIAPEYKKPEIVKRQVVVQPSSLPSLDTNSAGALLASIGAFFKNLFNL